MLKRAQRALRKKRGFSLIEILIVIAVIGMLMTIFFVSIQDSGVDEKTARLHMVTSKAKLDFALFEYKNKYGRYPTTDQGLDALLRPPADVDAATFPPRGFIEEKFILDPWKRKYEYISDGGSYEIKTLGADGQPGGEGNNRDIDLNSLN